MNLPSILRSSCRASRHHNPLASTATPCRYYQHPPNPTFQHSSTLFPAQEIICFPYSRKISEPPKPKLHHTTTPLIKRTTPSCSFNPPIAIPIAQTTQYVIAPCTSIPAVSMAQPSSQHPPTTLCSTTARENLSPIKEPP